MASFNEWLYRRDEAFHQDRFDKAMGREAGRKLFGSINSVKRIIESLGQKIGQLTRLKDPSIGTKLDNLTEKFLRMKTDDYQKEENLLDLYMGLSDAERKMKKAEKGMPDPALGAFVAAIMKKLEKISENLGAAGGSFILRHPSKVGVKDLNDHEAERKKLMRHANFKRSGKFGPDKYIKPHSSDFNPTEDDVLVIGDEDE